MSKDEVKIFTGSGTFKLPENKTETKKKTDEVHEHCGTDCCVSVNHIGTPNMRVNYENSLKGEHISDKSCHTICSRDEVKAPFR